MDWIMNPPGVKSAGLIALLWVLLSLAGIAYGIWRYR